jgi:L-ascorbate metabolism protein UlaG (beta-lactamase superfamily)
LIIFDGLNIYIDPFRLESINEKADLILVTHSHYDHLSIDDINKIIKSGTKIIGPADIREQLKDFRNVSFDSLSPGGKIEYHSVIVEGVNSYNINKEFHPKSKNWLGYILDFKGTRVYHSGDTDFIPEMKIIRTNVALIPVSGKYTMDVDEAITAVKAIKPDLAIPMHWGGIIGNINDANRFVEGCKKAGIDSRVLLKDSH